MHLIEKDQLKEWLENELVSVSDADPVALSKYIITLLSKSKPDDELEQDCNEHLEIFLSENTSSFLSRLFKVVREGLYINEKFDYGNDNGNHPDVNFCNDGSTGPTTSISSLTTQTAASDDKSKKHQPIISVDWDDNADTGNNSSTKKSQSDSSEELRDRKSSNSHKITENRYSKYSKSSYDRSSNRRKRLNHEEDRPGPLKTDDARQNRFNFLKSDEFGLHTLPSQRRDEKGSSRYDSFKKQKIDLANIKNNGDVMDFLKQMMTQIHGFNKNPQNRIGPFNSTSSGGPTRSQRGSNFDPNLKTLLLTRIPKEYQDSSKITEYFKKFGKLTDIKLPFNGENDSALLEFENHDVAHSAYTSPEAIFNNRFVRISWYKVHRPNVQIVTSNIENNTPSDSSSVNDSTTFKAENKYVSAKNFKFVAPEIIEEKNRRREELQKKMDEINTIKKNVVEMCNSQIANIVVKLKDPNIDNETRTKLKKMWNVLAKRRDEARFFNPNKPAVSKISAEKSDKKFSRQSQFATKKLDKRERSITIIPVKGADCNEIMQAYKRFGKIVSYTAIQDQHVIIEYINHESALKAISYGNFMPTSISVSWTNSTNIQSNENTGVPSSQSNYMQNNYSSQPIGEIELFDNTGSSIQQFSNTTAPSNLNMNSINHDIATDNNMLYSNNTTNTSANFNPYSQEDMITDLKDSDYNFISKR